MNRMLCGIVAAAMLLAAGCSASSSAPVSAPASPSAARPGATTAPAASQPAALTVDQRIVWPSGAVQVRLSNGLTLVVQESRTTPVVCVQSFVRAGSLYEGRFLGAGISHLCEHLVAEGAEKGQHAPAARGGKEQPKSSLESRIGGESNAFTSQDTTSYYITAASSKTAECIELISNWMVKGNFSREDFEREHGVVQRELQMSEDDPGREMNRLQSESFYRTHPAAVPVVGYLAPLAALTYEDVKEYHSRMYVPQNMVVVVIGDVAAQKVIEQVCQAFAGMPEGRKPDILLPDVAPIALTQTGMATNKRVTQAMEEMSFLTIPLVHEDLYALDVLSYVLTNGENSRLEQALVRKGRLVTAISSSSWTPDWGKGQFAISFRAAPAKVASAQQAVLDELTRLMQDGVNEEELARAKRQKVADYVYSQQTVSSRAMTFGSDLLATGNADFSRQYTERIQAVTAEQVQAAAKKYFLFDQMVITRLLPEAAAASRPAAASQPALAKADVFTLPNGLKVVLQQIPSSDLVSAVLACEGGVMLETPKTNGMGTLMASLATQGAGELSAEQIAAFFDSAGGSISGECGNNTFYWQMTVLADSYDKALDIFGDVVLRPTYPAKELDIYRPMLVDRIRSVEESWLGLLSKHFRHDFFGSSPLAMLASGSAEVVSAATDEAIKAYHDRYLKAGSSVLTVYGRFDAAKTRAKIEAMFGSMAAGKNDLPTPPRRVIETNCEQHIYPEKLQNAAIAVAVPGMTVKNLKDRIPMTVLDAIISGYQMPRGWLHDELRGKRLVYVVHAQNMAALAPGAFWVYAECAPENINTVAGIIFKNLALTRTYAYTQEEIDEAVNFILTADLLGHQEVSALAMEGALDELYGFGYDFQRKTEALYRQVKAADLTRVAREYFSGNFFVTVVMPKDAKVKDLTIDCPPKQEGKP